MASKLSLNSALPLDFEQLSIADKQSCNFYGITKENWNLKCLQKHMRKQKFPTSSERVSKNPQKLETIPNCKPRRYLHDYEPLIRAAMKQVDWYRKFYTNNYATFKEAFSDPRNCIDFDEDFLHIMACCYERTISCFIEYDRQLHADSREILARNLHYMRCLYKTSLDCFQFLSDVHEFVHKIDSTCKYFIKKSFEKDPIFSELPHPDPWKSAEEFNAVFGTDYHAIEPRVLEAARRYIDDLEFEFDMMAAIRNQHPFEFDWLDQSSDIDYEMEPHNFSNFDVPDFPIPVWDPRSQDFQYIYEADMADDTVHYVAESQGSRCRNNNFGGVDHHPLCDSGSESDLMWSSSESLSDLVNLFDDVIDLSQTWLYADPIDVLWDQVIATHNPHILAEVFPEFAHLLHQLGDEVHSEGFLDELFESSEFADEIAIGSTEAKVFNFLRKLRPNTIAMYLYIFYKAPTIQKINAIFSIFDMLDVAYERPKISRFFRFIVHFFRTLFATVKAMIHPPDFSATSEMDLREEIKELTGLDLEISGNSQIALAAALGFSLLLTGGMLEFSRVREDRKNCSTLLRILGDHGKAAAGIGAGILTLCALTKFIVEVGGFGPIDKTLETFGVGLVANRDWLQLLYDGLMTNPADLYNNRADCATAMQVNSSLEDQYMRFPAKYNLYRYAKPYAESVALRSKLRQRITEIDSLTGTKQEPVALNLYGSGGVGKSSTVRKIVDCLSELEGRPLTVYARNSGDKYWSGYIQQDVVIYDDFGTVTDAETETAEFMNAVSPAKMPLNMADLPTKGLLFTSRYVILCTNHNTTKSETAIVPAFERRKKCNYKVSRPNMTRWIDDKNGMNDPKFDKRKPKRFGIADYPYPKGDAYYDEILFERFRYEGKGDVEHLSDPSYGTAKIRNIAQEMFRFEREQRVIYLEAVNKELKTQQFYKNKAAEKQAAVSQPSTSGVRMSDLNDIFATATNDGYNVRKLLFISGPAGTGKSYNATRMQEQLGCVVLDEIFDNPEEAVQAITDCYQSGTPAVICANADRYRAFELYLRKNNQGQTFDRIDRRLCHVTLRWKKKNALQRYTYKDGKPAIHTEFILPEKQVGTIEDVMELFGTLSTNVETKFYSRTLFVTEDCLPPNIETLDCTAITSKMQIPALVLKHASLIPTLQMIKHELACIMTDPTTKIGSADVEVVLRRINNLNIHIDKPLTAFCCLIEGRTFFFTVINGVLTIFMVVPKIPEVKVEFKAEKIVGGKLSDDYVSDYIPLNRKPYFSFALRHLDSLFHAVYACISVSVACMSLFNTFSYEVLSEGSWADDETDEECFARMRADPSSYGNREDGVQLSSGDKLRKRRRRRVYNESLHILPPHATEEDFRARESYHHYSEENWCPRYASAHAPGGKSLDHHTCPRCNRVAMHLSGTAKNRMCVECAGYESFEGYYHTGCSHCNIVETGKASIKPKKIKVETGKASIKPKKIKVEDGSGTYPEKKLSIDEVSSLVSEGSLDPGFRSICELVTNNLIKIKSGFCLMIKGRYGVAPNHFTILGDLALEDGTPLETIKSFPNKDLILVKLPDTHREYRDITKHLGKPGFIEDVYPSYMIIKEGLSNYMYPVRCHTETKKVVTNVAGTINALPIELAVGAQYNSYITRPGDCGCPIIRMSRNGDPRIVGIHVASSSQMGFCSLITSGILEYIPVTSDMLTPEDYIVDIEPISLPNGKVADKALGTIVDGEYVPLSKFHVGKTRVCTSPLKYHREKQKFETNFNPPILSRNDPRNFEHIDPLYKNVDKFAQDHPKLDQDEINSTMHELASAYCAPLRTFDLKYRPMTNTEAINGRASVPESKPIDLNTSPGYPYSRLKRDNKGKRDFFDVVGDDANPRLFFSKKGHSVLDRLQYIEATMALGGTPTVVFDGNLKDEALKDSKIAEVKTRSIVAAPIDFVLLQRKYIHPLLYGIMRARHTMPIRVGLAANGKDWDHVWRNIQRPGNLGFDGDYGSFDASCSEEEIIGCGEFYIHLYKLLGYDNERTFEIIRGMYRVLSRPFITRGHLIFRANGCVVSGQACTVFDDSIINAGRLAIAYKKCVPPYLSSLSDFLLHCGLALGGDDHIVVPDEIVAPYVNFFRFKEIIELRGGVYTPANKEEDEITKSGIGLKPLAHCQFFKRLSVYNPRIGSYVGCLMDEGFAKLTSTTFSPRSHFYDGPKIEFDVEAMTSTFDSYLSEASLHSEEFYDDCLDHVFECSEKWDIPIREVLPYRNMFYKTYYEGRNSDIPALF